MPQPARDKPAAAKPPVRQPATFVAYDAEAYGEIVHPNRYDWYLIRRWLPDLGPGGFLVVKVLRDELFYNPRTGVLRDTCDLDMDDLARRCQMSRSKLFELFNKNAALGEFVQKLPRYVIKGDGAHRTHNRFRVSMTDPIHPLDREEYETILAQRDRERSNPQQPPKYIKEHESDFWTHESGMNPERAEDASRIWTCPPLSRPDSGQHKEILLPSGDSLLKDLTAAPDSPSHKCVPPGEAEPADPLQLAWQQALLTLSTVVNKPTFEAHIRTLRPVERVGDTVTLSCPSAFTREWIAKRHEAHLADALSAAVEQAITVQLVPPPLVPPPPAQAPIPAILPANVAEKADR